MLDRLKRRVVRWLIGDELADAYTTAKEWTEMRVGEFHQAHAAQRRAVASDLQLLNLKFTALAHHVAPVMAKQRQAWLTRLEQRIEKAIAEHNAKAEQAAKAGTDGDAGSAA